MADDVYELRVEAYVATILEIFAEAAHVPSHLRERRSYKQALLQRDRLQKEAERAKLARHADRFLRRRYVIEPLPATCACVLCRRTFGYERGLEGHWRYFHGSCVEAAE
jgi:hypothetical protein